MSPSRQESRVRVLFINPVREFGGGERWLIGLGTALTRAGHEVTLLARPAATWQPAACAAGLNALPVPMAHDLSLGAVRRLASVLRAAGPEVVVCCNQRGVRLGVMAARLAGGPPVVFRNGLAGSFKNSRFNRWLAGGITRFVVNARALAGELAGFGWVPPA